ncbi:MAG: HPr kinase/phosphorylase, partial [Clostridia bacterium]|nr:HPr kinase/phosphorylase [Clostridia bacterium]
MTGKYSVPLSKVIASEGYTAVYLPKPAEEIPVQSMEVNRPGLILARYDKNFAAERIEFVGNSESIYLQDLDDETRLACIRRLMGAGPVALVFSVMVPDSLIQQFVPAAEEFGVPLLKTNDHTSFATSSLVSFLNVELA